MLRPKWLTKKVFAWSLYDFADTVFSALFITFFFPILIKVYLGGTELQIGLVFGLSLLFAAFTVPLIGAIADASGRKIPILFISTLITVAITTFTGYVGLVAALILGFFANFFNIIDIDLYDALLIEISEDENRGRIAGFGVAVGYLGTLAALFMGYLLMGKIGWGTKEATQAIFPATAIFYFIFSLPIFFAFRDYPRIKKSFKQSFSTALKELKYTLTKMPEMRGLGSFLLSSFIYNNGMNTVILFLSLYATQVIGLSIQEFFFVFAFFAIGSFTGSLTYGRISDKLRPKKSLSGVLIAWVLIVIYFLKINTVASFIGTQTVFNILEPINNWFYSIFGIPNFIDPLTIAFLFGGFIGGAAAGSIWVANRHMVTCLAPKHKMAEIFGIEGLTEKFSGLFGPIIFGFIVGMAGPGNELIGYQNALWSILVFFFLGLIILWRIPEDVTCV